MDTGTQSIAMIAIVASIAGMAWALLWPGARRAGNDVAATLWELVYVDDDGVLLFTMVRVLHLNPETRRMTGWCSRTCAERVFKLSKIVKATDVNSGSRINLSKLVAAAPAVAGPGGAPHGQAGAQPEGAKGPGLTHRQAQHMDLRWY
jgi:hypothetical protein